MTHVTVRERASLGDLTRVGVSVHIRFRPWESSLIGDVRSWSLIHDDQTGDGINIAFARGLRERD